MTKQNESQASRMPLQLCRVKHTAKLQNYWCAADFFNIKFCKAKQKAVLLHYTG